MSSKEWITKVGAYLDGELDEAERPDVESHLRGCAECARAAESFRRLDEIAGRESVPSVTGEEWARVWDGILARRAAGEDLPVDEESSTGGRPPSAGLRVSGRIGGVFQVLRETALRGWVGSSSRRLAWGLGAAAAVLLVVLVLGWPEGGQPGGSGDGVAGPPRPSSEASTEDYAKHLEGPPPEIIVDPEEGATHLRYDDKF